MAMDERRSGNERIAVLETELKAMKRQHDDMARDIKIILATLSEAKGGWRMLLLVGGSTVLGYCGFAAWDDRSRRSSYVAYRSTVLARTGRVDDPDG